MFMCLSGQKERLKWTYKENADMLRHVEARRTEDHHYRHDDRNPHDGVLMSHYERFLQEHIYRACNKPT